MKNIKAHQKNKQTKKHKQGGFTLIEILIALFIFAIVSVLAITGLRHIIRQQKHINTVSAALGRLQLTMTLMQHDLSAMSPHSLKNNASDSGGPLLQSTGSNIRFITSNNANPGMYAPRSILRQVAYSVKDGILMRVTWPVADPLTTTPKITQALLPGITSLKVRFYDNQHQPQTSWPPNNPNDPNG